MQGHGLHILTKLFVGLGVFFSFVIIFCVATQTTKSEGLSGTIGGGRTGSVRGTRQDEFLAKITRVAGVGWIISYIALAATWNILEQP
jgi:protein translocase SecG subunit